MFSCAKKTATKASVVDNALIVSFFSAVEPRLWRVEMGQISNASFEVRESQGKFILALKPANAAAEDVSVFPDRDKAVDALEAVTTALMQGRQCSMTGRGAWFWVKKLLKYVLILFAILFVINFIVAIKNGPPVHSGGNITAPAVRSGVPVPADQLFGQ
jgi:hypothetical protein